MRELPGRAVAQQRTQQQGQQQKRSTDSLAAEDLKGAARGKTQQLPRRELRQARREHEMRCRLWDHGHRKWQAGHRATSAEGDRRMLLRMEDGGGVR